MPVSIYTFVTLGQAEADLASRLGDLTGQFWTAAERGAYLIEGLRVWNALTSTWRDFFLFALAPPQWWYDLTAQAGTLRPMTLSDSDLLSQVNYHLLEPQFGAYPISWAGSLQFSLRSEEHT